MNTTHYLILASLLASTTVHAVNKCTNPDNSTSYQDAPCQREAKTGSIDIPRMKAAKAPEGVELENKKAQCAEAIKRSSLWKDPDSVKVGSVVRVGPGQSFKRTLGTIIWYGADVNAKNSYGGYTGYKTVFCEFDMEEKQIINIHINQS